MAGLAGMDIFDTPIDMVGRASGATLYVNTTGSDGAYISIQDAINAANPGDTVFVYRGTYNESVEVNRTIDLIGEHMNFTVIDGGNYRDVVLITADKVNLTGFTIKGNDTGWDHAGIKLESVRNCEITDNIVVTNKHIGVFIYYSTSNNFSGNIMLENGFKMTGSQVEHLNSHNIDESNTVNGRSVVYWKNQNNGIIPLDAGQIILANCSNIIIQNQELTNGSVAIIVSFTSNSTIKNNNISSNHWDGISIGYSNGIEITNNTISYNGGKGIVIGHSNNNSVSDNSIVNNNYDGIAIVCPDNKILRNDISNNRYGLSISYTNSNNVMNNTISNNIWGAKIASSFGNNIINNTFYTNSKGLTFERSFQNNIVGNTINSNEMVGIYLSSSNNNIFHHNNIINNPRFQVEIWNSTGNVWDDGNDEGNHWSDYEGLDDGSNGRIANDGVGDTKIPHPYEDKGEGYYRLDFYPLSEPIPDTNPPRIQLISPGNNSVIQAGTVIDFDIYDGNLNFVSCSVNGTDCPSFSAPYNLSTNEWTDGEYRVQITAFDLTENSNTRSFFFIIDNTAPYIISSSPQNNSNDIDIDIIIAITFSEPMNSSDTIDHLSFYPYVQFTTTWSENKDILYISFEENNLANKTKYTLTIDSSINDISMNPMNSDYVLVFTTVPSDKEGKPQDMVWLLLFLIIIIVVILIIFMIIKKGKKSTVD